MVPTETPSVPDLSLAEVFAVGDLVVLHSLGRTEMNGLGGLVVEVPASGARLGVELESGRKVSLKKDNLRKEALNVLDEEDSCADDSP